jgi:NadR type nicotinamide-nucleotide adenylyltransferase
MARFRCGLVVGKFSPLHHGHEALIRRALDSCDEVIVISYSRPEYAGCEATRRAQWLSALFPTTKRIVVTDEFLGVPDNDAPEAEHRDFCALLCETHFGTTVDVVFTSEDYGTGFADHLTRRYRAQGRNGSPVAHVCLDRHRVKIPISGSEIRADVHAHRNWLSPTVYASFVKQICVLGGESSGKSVLTEALAERFDTVFVPEYGRELWVAKGGKLAYEDLLDIALRQVEREQQAALRSNRFLFCDTSPLTTLFYSVEMFGRADAALEALALRPYELHVLCAPDFEFVQDGTRRDAEFRRRQHAWYVEQLERRGLRYLLVEGSVRARVERVAGRLGLLI